MSSVYSSGSRVSSRQASDSTIVKFWDEHIKGMLFGVMYAMVKENTMGKGFTIVTIVFEFLEMIILCFREQFKWGGLKYSFDFDDSMIGFSAFQVIFWMIVAIIGLALVMCGYIGYTFYKGEIKLTFLLRIFRYIVGVFMSILFLPFLFFLFSALACDYSTKPTATLLLYHSVSCWGSHTIPSIISIVLVVAFSLLCLFASTTLYEHDPTVNKSSGKLQNRFEFFSLSMRLVYIIVTVFLMRNSIAFAAVAFWVSLILFIASVLTLPCYDHKLNLMRSGMYAGVTWVNIGMIISLATNNNNNIIPLLISLIGFPIAMLAGAFAADRRFKYLCNPTLVDGFVSSSEMETLPAQKKKKSVNFEGPSKSNKLVKNHLYSRLWFPWDVEIAARFANGNPNAALIEKGKLVYQTGISKFPKSPSVMQGYANFMFTTVGDWQLGYVILEKLRKMRAVIDIQFFIYRYDKDRERRIEGGNDRIGDFMDFMEYKKLQQAARRHHTTSLVCVRKFWRYLLEPKVDVMQLSLLSSKIALAQRKAEEHYTKLLKNYPKNVSLLRDYAKYLDEVALDERQAQEMRRKADKYEQLEMESATASHRSNANNVLPETFTRDGETNSDRDSEARSENSETMDDDHTASSKSSGVRAKLVEARLDKNNSLKKLGWIMFATTVFSLAVGLTELIVLDKMISSYSYSLESQNSAGGAAHISMKLSRSVADSYSVGVKTFEVGRNVSYPYLAGSTYNGISSDNIVSTYMFQNILKSLYWGDSDTDSFTSRRFMRIKQKYGFKPKIDISNHSMNYNEFDHKLPNKKNVLKFFNEARYNETLYVNQQNDTDTSISASREYDNIGLWTLCSIFSQTVIEVAKIPLWHYSDSKLVNTHGVVYSYSLENSQEIAKGMLDIVTFYGDRISDSLQLIMLTCMIIFIVAAALLIVASLGMFRPIVQKIFTAKVKTFSMFTIIPTSVVKVMSRRRIAAATHNYSSDEEEEEKDKGDYFTEESGKDGATQEPTRDNEQDQQGTPPHELISFNSFKNNVSLPSDDYNNNDNDNSPHCLTINVVSSCEDREKNEEKEGREEKEDNKDEEEDEEMKVPDTPIRAMKRRISSLSNLFRIKTNYKKVEDEKEKEKEEEKHKEEKIEQEKKKQIHSKHSRLDTSSLSAVTRKLHLSYLLAIGCIVVSFLVSFLLIRRFLGDLVTIASDMQMTDLRTQYIQTLSMDLSLLTVYPYGDPVAEAYYNYAQQDMQQMWLFYNDIEPKSYQMDILYSENCFIINSTACPDKSDYRYDLISNGFDYAFFKYYMITKDLLGEYQSSKLTMDIDDPNYAVFRYLADWMIDGSETLTYLVYRDAKDRISATKNYIAIITAVECVAFILIHVIIFKPFVTQLKNESDHTFALIRMIPRKLLQNVPEIQQFIQDTLAGDDSDSD